MALLRTVLEALLAVPFWIARAAFGAFAVAALTALVGAGAMGGPEAPAWLAVVTRSCLLIGGTFLLAAVLLYVAPGLRAPAAAESDGPPGWIWLLGLTLVALPALAWQSAADLLALWREILVLLERVGFWQEFQRGGQFSGLVMLPIMAGLFVPALEAIAAAFLIAVPLGLLALLPTRSRQFPRFFTMLVVCQAALVLASAIGADAFARLAGELIASMRAAEDAEVQQASEMLDHAVRVLGATSTAFVTPLLGSAAWIPVLLVSPLAAAFFDASATQRATAIQPAWSPASLAQPLPAPTPAPRAAPGASRHARYAAVALGVVMLLFSLGQALRPRAHYASSDPAPGATLTEAPAVVRVRFGREIGASSALFVDRVTPGEDALRVGASSGLDPADPERRTLVAELPGAERGLYQVSWLAEPSSGGFGRNGSFRFGVGMAVAGSALEEGDVGVRQQRKTVLGAVILIGLGVLSPLLPRRG